MKIPELLAPAGTEEAVRAVLDAGADAVYLGARRFNMRQHRPTLNFTEEALARSVGEIHARSKKVYIVLNNLFSEGEMGQVEEELRFIAALRPDAIIVQDIGAVMTARKEAPGVPLHASTMMNIHNRDGALALKALGFTRIIASRDIGLRDLKRLSDETGMEWEYFLHGDMCVAQGSQCYQSTFAFGESGNRGRCMKPCRWRYDLIERDAPGERVLAGGRYSLARKDLCLYGCIPQLVSAGIASLKIEGRARPPGYLGRLVELYRRALDRYAADSSGDGTDDAGRAAMRELRIREVSTCAAFGRPGAESVDLSGRREPHFFSTAGREPSWAEFHDGKRGGVPSISVPPLLAAKVATAAQARAAAEAGARRVYLAAVETDGFASRASRESLVAGLAERGAALFVASPRVTQGAEETWWSEERRAWMEAGAAGVLAGNIGALAGARRAGAREIIADFSLNVMNARAAAVLEALGATGVTASLEMEKGEVRSMAARSPLPVECLVHGTLPGMLLDYCPVRAQAPEAVASCARRCARGRFALRDMAGGVHRLEADRFCRLTLTAAGELCALPLLEALAAAGVSSFRIEGQYYGPAELGAVTGIYRGWIDALASGATRHEGELAADLTRLEKVSPAPLGPGAYMRGCLKKSWEGKRLEKILVGAGSHS